MGPAEVADRFFRSQYHPENFRLEGWCMRWYQVVAWVLLAWCGVAAVLTPLVALFIRGGKRAHVIRERQEWARMRRERESRAARRRTGTSG